MRLFRNICALLSLLAIGVTGPAAAQGPGADGQWRRVVTDQDRLRLRGWRAAWTQALAAARRQGAAQIDAGGALFDPDAALLDPAPPAGRYRCRTYRLGHRNVGPDWIAGGADPCRIVQAPDGMLHFERLSGQQRPGGRLFPAGTRRLVFLGSLMLGDERRALRYGSDPQRDLAGVLERVGPRRWRLVFPRPTFQSIIDVIELVPAA